MMRLKIDSNLQNTPSEIDDEVHSDEIQEVIHSAPSWILVWGIPLITAILLIIFGVCTLIKYPDILKVSFKKEIIFDPQSVRASSSARIKEVFIKSGSEVKKGQVLAFLECNLNLEHVLNLSHSLKDFLMIVDKPDIITKIRFIPPSQVNLGDLQNEYNHLYEKLLSPNMKKPLLIKSHVAQFKSKLDSIQGKYILTAPSEGKVGFSRVIQKGILLDSNQKVLSIYPSNENYYGIIEVNPNDIAKIRIGQKVLITSETFTSNVDNALTGRISYIADEPDERNLFICKVSFHDFSKNSMQIRDFIKGEGNIVLTNKSLLSRLIEAIS